MIYINENSQNIDFPRVSKSLVNKLVITNQTTKQVLEIITDDSYNVDISSNIGWFAVGQYDYQFKNNDKVISCGILQFGDYTPTNEKYTSKRNIIQYKPY